VRFTTCTAALTFDTVMAIYTGCPRDPNDTAQLVACNDDDPDSTCEGSSTIRLVVQVSSRRWVQVAGRNGAEGQGELFAASCVGDFDGVVALPDLSLMLSQFGECGAAAPCETDLEDDGDVDLTDLAVLLSRFGTACP